MVKQRTPTEQELLRVKEILIRFDDEEDGEVESYDITNWSEWALGASPQIHLKHLRSRYVVNGAKYTTKVMEVLAVFYPEINSPLWDVLSED